MSPSQADLLRASLAGYLFGALPVAKTVGRIGGVDVQSGGTRNPGARNVARLLGRRAGTVVAVLDISKGMAASAVGRRLAGPAGGHVSAVAAVAGHCYPAQTRFRGGGGVATSFGQCLATFPAYAPADVAVAVCSYRFARRSRTGFAVGASSMLWVGAGWVWWKRQLPNLWGPRPSVALPAANAATSLLILSRAIWVARQPHFTELDVV